ncbi:27207_t:CDS:1 [Dentiscutata erythropus]|uniref:27207_t:CDS:1 n=1 Tax=Dentiscutata erythropus TaxID=1348616 RepID=A0A9N8VQ72_9GLOM|nr:27207_t:CDS:1 [Dentiscutata erythropus]
MSALNERLNKDRILYILIQVKNWSTDNKDDDYLCFAIAKLSPEYIKLEKLLYMPFLSLYLQLGSTAKFFNVPTEYIQTCQVKLYKRKIEEVLKDYQIGDNIKTRSEFVKKIRIDDNKSISGAKDTAFREHFQRPLVLFRLFLNIYSCLEQSIPVSTTSPSTITNDLTSSFKQLLTAWIDSTSGNT